MIIASTDRSGGPDEQPHQGGIHPSLQQVGGPLGQAYSGSGEQCGEVEINVFLSHK